MKHTPATLALALALVSVVVACNVDETGYLVPPEVDYTAEAGLDPVSDVPLLIVGRPGAVTTGGGTLTVTNPRSGQAQSSSIDETRSFVFTLDGRLGDAIDVTYVLDDDSDSFELTLEDDLTGITQPNPGTGSLLSSPNTNGEVTVFVSGLVDPTPPVVIVNVTSGFVTEVDDVSADIEIPAAQDDEICLYYRTSEGLSQTTCQMPL